MFDSVFASSDIADLFSPKFEAMGDKGMVYNILHCPVKILLLSDREIKAVFFNLLFYSRKSFNAKHPSVSCSSEKLFQFLFIGVQQLFGVLMAHTLVMIWSTSYSRPSGVINEYALTTEMTVSN